MKNIILADCNKDEIDDLCKGLSDILSEEFEIHSLICNRSHGSKLKTIKRYFYYMVYPIIFVINRKKYKYILGWQQFYALFFAFYCSIFHLKKNVVVALNFTYKDKKGFAGKIYKKFMTICVKNLDYIHVLSKEYAVECGEVFGISQSRFIVTPFGIPDTFEKEEYGPVEYTNFSFSIGRSNRDFVFLAEAWKLMPDNELLVIASDTFKPEFPLPKNVIHRSDIKGKQQFDYILNCKAMIIPIKEGNICSGDTVLLKAMSYKKAVIVTIPSTLAEMYIEDGVNGILVPKRHKEFAETVLSIYNDKEQMSILSENARSSYLQKFSRYNMGKRTAEKIMQKDGI